MHLHLQRNVIDVKAIREVQNEVIPHCGDKAAAMANIERPRHINTISGL